MRVFVTGSTGFIGSAVVRELLSAGHQVLGLSRTEKGVDQLKSQGAEALHGSIEDPEVLIKCASDCDATIHLAFVHGVTDFAGSCATDRAAIAAIGNALVAAGGERTFIITSGTAILPQDKLATEDDVLNPKNPMAVARGTSEAVCLDFAKEGVRAIVLRMPVAVHGPGPSGFMRSFIGSAMKNGVAAYIGSGENCWPAAHRDDVAQLYLQALEKAKSGSVFHAVAEEGVLVKDIAAEVGKQLNIPVASIPPEKGDEHFGFFRFGAVANNKSSSLKTREQMGWNPTNKTLIEDIPIIVEFLKSQAS